jgi:LL-diaminopimelate aminotransferase
LSPEGLSAMEGLVSFYKENTRILRETFNELGFKTYGGVNAPYVWVQFPGRSSWEVFEEILTKANIVTTPGSGFGPGGEGFVRASAFGHRENILEAIERLKKLYKK